MNKAISGKRFITAALFALAISGGFFAGSVSGAQPQMQEALDSLREARTHLKAATKDKGGHREKAIDLVNRAINEVEKGIAYDRRH